MSVLFPTLQIRSPHASSDCDLKPISGDQLLEVGPPCFCHHCRFQPVPEMAIRYDYDSPPSYFCCCCCFFFPSFLALFFSLVRCSSLQHTYLEFGLSRDQDERFFHIHAGGNFVNVSCWKGTFYKDPIPFLFVWVYIPVGVGRRWQQHRCLSSELVVVWLLIAFHSLGFNMLTLPKIESSFFRSNSFQEKIVKMVSRSISFKNGNSESLSPSPRNSGKIALGHLPSFKNWEPEKKVVEDNASFKIEDVESNLQSHASTLFLNGEGASPKPPKDLIELISPKPRCELDAAAVKLQKVYKSYRTRRNLADCAVVIEELWWKALDSATLKLSSVSFFEDEKQETAVSRWTRAKKRVAKVGKGLSKDEKAQKLALQHWLEAIDPRHRYGHNLHLYYDVWFGSESTQPFFYWLDIGDGKEVNLVKCPRTRLHQQCIKYLGPNEREAYEVIVEEGKLVYKQSQSIVNTVEGSKWIFVLSTTRNLYVGQKKKGTFQHSSFLAGAATSAAGRLVAKDGILEAIWPYSGHYLPTEENFKVFISFLTENNVDLTSVKRCSVDDDDFSSFKKSTSESTLDLKDAKESTIVYQEHTIHGKDHSVTEEENAKPPAFQFSKHPSCKWTSGTGPRIGCVRDYPADLQFMALEQVNLSPRVTFSPITNKVPIPSPRPSPKIRLSPRLATMGIPSPRVSLTLPTFKH